MLYCGEHFIQHLTNNVLPLIHFQTKRFSMDDSDLLLQVVLVDRNPVYI